MKKHIIFLFFALFLSVGCGDSESSSSGGGGGETFSDGDFGVILSYFSSQSIINIVYDENVTGNVKCLIDKTERDVTDAASFMTVYDANVTYSRKNVDIVDDGYYDNYISVSSLDPNTTYHVYIYWTDTGDVYHYSIKTTATLSTTNLTQQSTSDGVNYWRHIPAEYSAASSKKWPLMIYAHGSGVSLSEITVAGPAKAALLDCNFPFIGIFPHFSDTSTTFLAKVDALIDDIISTYNVDTDRIYITGFSQGSNVVHALNYMGNAKYIGFHTLAGGTYSEDWANALADVNTWQMVNVNDTSYHTNVENMYNAIVAADGSGEHLHDVVSLGNGGHVDSVIIYESPWLYKWFLSKSK